MPWKQRRHRPAAPGNLSIVLAKEVRDEEVVKFNEAAAALWNEEVLEMCKNCSR